MNYKKRKKEKIGIVLTGGGKRCAYTAGALLALHEVFGFDEPFALGAESGSAGNAFYYLSKQYALARKVWTEYLLDPKFTRLTKFDIDYLIDVIFKKKAPLDTRALDHAKTKYFVPITNVQTGAIEFVTNHSPFDYFEILRAAKALPIVYRKKVRLGLKKYIDGGMTSDIQTGTESTFNRSYDTDHHKLRTHKT
jgi:predicted patatin/cPLA2 family phospholipase